MTLCVSGAVEHARIRDVLARAMGPLAAGEALRPTATPGDDTQDAPRFLHVDDDGAQTSVQILFRGIAETDPQYPALLMLGRLIDDGMSTRLHRRLVDELGLAYYVSATPEHLVDTGLYEVDANCRHEHVPRLVDEALKLLARLRDEAPTPDELDKARRRYRWDLEASFDDPDAMAAWMGGWSLFSDRLGPPPSFDERVARLHSVTPDAVCEVARRLFRPERLVVVCVGRIGKRRAAEVRGIVENFR
jgi:predicted Zn-dependent peptidase